jgi:hypothetical protein
MAINVGGVKSDSDNITEKFTDWIILDNSESRIDILMEHGGVLINILLYIWERPVYL